MGTEKGLIFGSMSAPFWGYLDPYRNWPDVVIAADGGLGCARAAGFSPDFYIGDSDSGGTPEAGMDAIRLKPEKDDTDLQAAYCWAKGQGIRQLIFTGCSGGRQDHHLAALQLLETAARDGIEAYFLDPVNRIRFLLPGTYNLPNSGYHYFSIIPVDSVLKGLSIIGAKYPLGGRDVFRGDSLTVSNEWAADVVTVQFTGGCCFLIESEPIE